MSAARAPPAARSTCACLHGGSAGAHHRSRARAVVVHRTCATRARLTRSRRRERRRLEPAEKHQREERPSGRSGASGGCADALIERRVVKRTRGYAVRRGACRNRNAPACCWSTSGNVDKFLAGNTRCPVTTGSKACEGRVSAPRADVQSEAAHLQHAHPACRRQPIGSNPAHGADLVIQAASGKRPSAGARWPGEAAWTAGGCGQARRR